ncbi:hypothetical protein QKT49_gp049 [Acanthamoeba castellanii medusavirus]|uniref:Uncharacterized protein n=1 Tax=Acanthamoeba castellanii medusavirus J1 TaxID=3114988 RepID=A0A3T1CWK4_9VIRU|nr:hypothetical protein QKT49_gp049 [Acanthamoeba castellanii medusavirus]BBI30189.1 hypothetical protein [Acanthamoeba castellanii medusavirus J1]
MFDPADLRALTCLVAVEEPKADGRPWHVRISNRGDAAVNRLNANTSADAAMQAFDALFLRFDDYEYICSAVPMIESMFSSVDVAWYYALGMMGSHFLDHGYDWDGTRFVSPDGTISCEFFQQ